MQVVAVAAPARPSDRRRLRRSLALTLALLSGTASAEIAAPTAALDRQGRPAVPASPTGLDARGHLLAVGTAPASGFSYVRLRDGVQLRVGGLTKNLIFYGPGTVRVNVNAGQNYWTAPSLAVIGKPGTAAFTVRETSTTLEVATGRLTVVADKRTGAITFKDGRGKVYTQECTNDPESVRRVQISGAPSYEVENRFTLKPEEAIYGFGFTTNTAEINRRGKELLLVQDNIGIIIPVMMSSERYGVLWDTYSQMRFKDDADGARLWAESAPGGVDYYFMAGDVTPVSSSSWT